MTSSARRVAIVTGANKGIGLAIVKGLCEGWKGDVYLTARDESRGRQAVEELGELGLKPIFHPLDVTDEDSVRRFRDHIATEYGRIDILVNNAAVAFKTKDPTPISVQAETTTFVNYFSLVSVCDILFPLLGPGSRVVNLTSLAGKLSCIPSGVLRKRFSDKSLTVEGLSALVREFVESTKRGTNEEDGWGSSSYVVSKVAASALTFIHDREYGPQGVLVNCAHPGLVVTDMSSQRGDLTPEEGAKAPLLLATGKDEKGKDFKGVFMWFDCTLIDWYADV